MAKHHPRPRLLVFVIAYHAEATLTAVLKRIPRAIFAEWETHVLVVDDASADRTYAIGRAYQTGPSGPAAHRPSERT